MLPIYAVQADILDALRRGNRLVLTAPTGSGKTTQVPQMLLEAGLFSAGQRMVVLQPRRLATRLVAQRVAAELNVPLGGLVGYQTRHDSKVSRDTVVRFMTEGLFLRQLQGEPGVPNVGAVVLDEFHERSLAADTVLALVKRLQETARPDLKLIVMSATLDAAKVAAYLSAPSFAAGGRMFPVEVNYLPRRSAAPPWDLAAEALAGVLASGGGEEGDVLIFMPGAYEIRRTIDACRRVGQERFSIFPLYGELPAREQDAALAPASGGNRKVIVSTNVAETSITIEGIRHVIDSGLARVHRYDARRGINVLLIEPISQGSADQRAGRAGRTAPGTCHRLWPEAEHKSRKPHETPEVQRLDLAEVVLQLKSMGVEDVASFPWLEPPTALAVERATRELTTLGAIDATGKLTATGRAMAPLPMHPRLSRMLQEAAARGCLERAALWAALLSERDILVRGGGRRFMEAAESEGGPKSDLVVLERAFEAAVAANFDAGRCAAMGVHANACRELERTRRLFLESGTLSLLGRGQGEGRAHYKSDAIVAQSGGVKTRAPDPHPNPLPKRERGSDTASVLECLLVGFPDHVAVRRSAGNLNCALVGQSRRAVVLDTDSVAKHVGLLLAAEIRELGAGQSVKTVLSLASELEPAWLEEVYPDRVQIRHETRWNPQAKAVETAEQRVFDDLVFDETVRPAADADEAAAVLADQIVRSGFVGELRPDQWDERVEQWIARTRSVGDWFPERRLIRYDEEDLRVIVQEICSGASRLSQVKDRPCLPAVRDALSWDDQQFVERMAPERIELAGGWKMKVEYSLSGGGGPPRGRAKIQDFYGMTRTPTVAGGKVRVLLEILGPNFRPVQVTDDLASFWEKLYPVLKKELSRKYPRHEWR